MYEPNQSRTEPVKIMHQYDMLHAVMYSIKSGLCSIICKKYTKSMILSYFDRIKNTDEQLSIDEMMAID